MSKSLLLSGFLFITTLSFAQQDQTNGLPSTGKCVNCITPLDGTGTLGLTYRGDSCGLNYVAVSNKLGQRYTPTGLVQPAAFAVSGIPSCAAIEKAFVWCDFSGDGSAMTLSVTNPSSVSQNFPMTMIGSGPDKCWSYSGTYTYRADITSVIAGNGNYMLSGLPVSTSSATNDADGAVLMIIFRDPTATYEGHILIHDGAMVQAPGQATYTLSNINACGAGTNSRVFMTVADLQNVGTTYSMNSVPFTMVEDWWNYVDQTTANFTTASTSCIYDVNSSGDCFNLLMAGLYYQTTSCVTCTPQSSFPLNVNATATGTCTAGTGSASATATGGTAPYNYSWSNGGTTQTITGLNPGTYIVNVTDASGCAAGSDTVVIPNPVVPNAVFTVTPSGTANYPGQVCVTDNTAGAASWVWAVNGIPSDTNASYCYTLPDTGLYCFTLLVANAAGCTDTASQCVRALGEAVYSIPNVFTPNGDGTNDVFTITSIGLTAIHCEIYDRWGILIGQWDGVNGSWNGNGPNGKRATDGVYYYVAKLTTTKGDVKDEHGFLHLISLK